MPTRFWALQQRLHPAESRVRLLAEETPASFFAFDLLALGEIDYTPRPFHERRSALEGALAAAAPPIHLTPVTRDERQAREWFEQLEGTDGLIIKDGEQPYRPGERVMRKLKHQRTADCVVAGYRAHASDSRLVGSLLLGLYDDGAAPVEWARAFGGLVPIGVVGAFPMARRRELFTELAPLVVDAADHPWAHAEPEAVGGPGSRWSPGKSLSFVPLRPERVVEVRYGQIDGRRLRYPAQFVRWRPDRDPSSCGLAQLDPPARRPIAPDYDTDPERFRLARSVQRRHARMADIHAQVAQRLLAEGATPVLDVGCGEGELARHLPEGAWVGLDSSRELLARAPRPAHLGDANALPFPDGGFGAVTLLYVLYHLAEPGRALAEAHRVLRPGGMVAVAAPSRHDSPELADALARPALTFDAELAPEMLAEHFARVEVERWDAPLIELPTHEAVREYLVGKGVEPQRARSAAAAASVPLAVTKRGAVAYAWKA